MVYIYNKAILPGKSHLEAQKFLLSEAGTYLALQIQLHPNDQIKNKNYLCLVTIL